MKINIDKLLESQNSLKKTIQLVLALPLISNDLINIVLNYCDFLLLEWMEPLQSKLDDSIFSTYPLHMQLMIKNFIKTLQKLDENPDQPLELNDDMYSSREFKKPSSALKFLTASGLMYDVDGDDENFGRSNFYKLRDLFIDLGLEQKSMDLIERTSLLSGAKEYALKKSDLSFLFKLHADTTDYDSDEKYTISKVTELLNNLNNSYESYLYSLQENENKYSLMVFPGCLSNILEDLSAHKQAYIDFQKYGVLSPGLITLNMIDKLSIFPTVISQLVCTFLYLDLNKTIFSLAGDIGILYERHYGIPKLFCPWDYLLTSLRRISKQKALKICSVNHDTMNHEAIYYPNPLQAIIHLNEGRYTIVTIQPIVEAKVSVTSFA